LSYLSCSDNKAPTAPNRNPASPMGPRRGSYVPLSRGLMFFEGQQVNGSTTGDVPDVQKKRGAIACRMNASRTVRQATCREMYLHEMFRLHDFANAAIAASRVGL
jgi:hypothetical protein